MALLWKCIGTLTRPSPTTGDCRFSQSAVQSALIISIRHLSRTGEGRVRDLGARRYFFSAAHQNFDAWRQKAAPGAKVPHPALRADLSRRGEVTYTSNLRKSTITSCGRGKG